MRSGFGSNCDVEMLMYKLSNIFIIQTRESWIMMNKGKKLQKHNHLLRTNDKKHCAKIIICQGQSDGHNFFKISIDLGAGHHLHHTQFWETDFEVPRILKDTSDFIWPRILLIRIPIWKLECQSNCLIDCHKDFVVVSIIRLAFSLNLYNLELVII